MSKARKAAGFAVAALVVAAAVATAFWGLRQRERGDQIAASRQQGFPVKTSSAIVAIQAYGEDGAPPRPATTDPELIAAALAMLANAPRAYFGDPEPRGALYRVEFRREGKAPLTFEVNDLRGSGAGAGGKIYPTDPKPGEVWSLTAPLLERLVGPIKY